MTNDDMELVRAYAAGQSEQAFEALVANYVHFVYSTALRQVQDPHLAEEVTQAVFVILARKSGTLGANTILPSWLYRTTGFCAADALKIQRRRAQREQEAYMQSQLNEPESEAWPHIAPLLDAAIARLSEKDRHAIVLRFFQNKTLNEIGVVLGASEEAAKKRVNRALEKLRTYFFRRGVKSTTATIACAISANSIQAAPVALAKTVTAVALAKGATTSTTTLIIAKGALNIMGWTKTQAALVAAAILLLTVGATTVTVKEIADHGTQAWQRGFDMSVLDRVTRQAKILPALRSRPQNIQGWNIYHGMYLGLNVDMPQIAQAAYDITPARLIISAPVPDGTYDFISNVPKDQDEALQQEIKDYFGLVGRREWIQTNFLALVVLKPNAPGLKRSFSGNLGVDRSGSLVSLRNVPVAGLPSMLERRYKTPVVDRTGLTGYFDLKWDNSKPDGFKEAVQDNLGLALVPENDLVEFVVMDKAN
jgi:uncharacterized protein (TIGR03435 family)